MPSHSTRSTSGNQPNHHHPIMSPTKSSRKSSSASLTTRTASVAYHPIWHLTLPHVRYLHTTTPATRGPNRLPGYGYCISSFSWSSLSVSRSRSSGAYIIGIMESINVNARGELGMMTTSLVHTDNEVGRSRERMAQEIVSIYRTKGRRMFRR